MLGQLSLVSVIVGLLLPLAASAKEKAPEPPPRDRVGLDVWLASSCPSNPGAKEKTAYLSGSESGAPQTINPDDRAKQVRETLNQIALRELSSLTTSPGFLFRKGDEPSSPRSYILPGCAIFAISDSSPEHWCKEHNAPFATHPSCDPNGNNQLPDMLETPLGALHRGGQQAPTFYAEVELLHSAGQNTFLPRLQTLYYPSVIHPRKGFKKGKARDLSITLTAHLAGGQPAMSTLSLLLRDLVPNPELQVRDQNPERSYTNDTLNNTAQTHWIVVTTEPQQIEHVSPGEYFQPVNLSASVTEIGDPTTMRRLTDALSSTNDLWRILR